MNIINTVVHLYTFLVFMWHCTNAIYVLVLVASFQCCLGRYLLPILVSHPPPISIFRTRSFGDYTHPQTALGVDSVMWA